MSRQQRRAAQREAAKTRKGDRGFACVMPEEMHEDDVKLVMAVVQTLTKVDGPPAGDGDHLMRAFSLFLVMCSELAAVSDDIERDRVLDKMSEQARILVTANIDQCDQLHDEAAARGLPVEEYLKEAADEGALTKVELPNTTEH